MDTGIKLRRFFLQFSGYNGVQHLCPQCYSVSHKFPPSRARLGTVPAQCVSARLRFRATRILIKNQTTLCLKKSSHF